MSDSVDHIVSPVGEARDPFVPPPRRGPVEVLVVCRLNAARSPLVEHLLGSALDRAAPGGFRVSSAGTRAVPDGTLSDGARRVLERRGLAWTGFTSTPLTAEGLADVDLVLTAEGSQARRVVDLAPSLVKKTFTVLEFAEVARRRAGAPLGDARSAILAGARRRPRDVDGTSRAYDLPDPVGPEVADEFDALERRIDDAVDRIVPFLTGGRSDDAQS